MRRTKNLSLARARMWTAMRNGDANERHVVDEEPSYDQKMEAVLLNFFVVALIDTVATATRRPGRRMSSNA